MPVEAVVAEVKPAGPIQVEFELSDLDGEMRSIEEWGWHPSNRQFLGDVVRTVPARDSAVKGRSRTKHGPDGYQVIGIAVEFLEPVIAYAASQAEFNYPSPGGRTRRHGGS